MRERVAEARVARLGTVTAGGRPHLVPCCFALVGDTVYSAVDTKPKSTLALRRLANVRANGRATLLVDHYAEDWSALWWVRADGVARVVDEDEERDGALRSLAAKYPQYRRRPPPGPVLAIDVTGWRGWDARSTTPA
jgi:PPOX class probable F420-dependent enzyme